MQKVIGLVLLLTFFVDFSYAQCGSDEIEVKVIVATDNWGYETSWILTDLSGAVIMQGGQDGVYDNNATYADSICVLTDGCYFFEIFDTYGDGIYAPNGFELYVDELLVASAANDIESYAIETVSCENPCGIVVDALESLAAHLEGANPLTPAELLLARNAFEQFPACLAENESTILLGKAVVAAFDTQVGALFTTPNTINGFSKDPDNANGLELELAILSLQQGIFDQVFTPAVYTAHPEHLNNWQFNSCFSFPGHVDPPADSSEVSTMLIRANFADPDGMNPYFDFNGDGTAHALRPTGQYLAPGSVATVTVPASLVGQDFYVRVGSHEWDLGIRPVYRRLDRISKKFPIDATTIEVFNPFGGAISVLVPYNADEGIIEVSITNGVDAPFFSLKSFYESPDFTAELNKPGPWAVFETDNVMYTIPKHSIVPGQYDLRQAMLDWDAALQGVNSIMAREIVPDKHNMYMIADITIRHNVYSVGYPMSNTPLNYANVPGPAYFINGPGPDDETNFHESGHGLAMSKFPGEVEAVVNFPYIMALNFGLGVDLDEAVNYSFVPNTFDIDRTATHRMVSNTFGTERDISNTTTDEVRYQHRGYGHYFEIVNILGWCPLRNFWRQEFIDFENGIDHGINNQDIDSRIVRMSVAAQVDLRPLFHVFGILPQDAAAVQAALEEMNVLPSIAIYNRLQAYFDLIPANNAEFVAYALSVYPNLYTDGPNDNPDFGVGWHYLKSLSYDAAEAQERTASLQSIVDLYFPGGQPTDNTIPDVCCMLDTLNLVLDGDEVVITGGVEPYDVSIETAGDIQTITVVDYDGCASTIENVISTVTEEAFEAFQLYPNPVTDILNLEFSEMPTSVDNLQIRSINGQLLRQYPGSERALDLSFLPQGMYLLQVQQANGSLINRRFLVLR